jgi:hypothetical protein
MINYFIKLPALIASMFSVIILSACSTNAIKQNEMTIELVNSSDAIITRSDIQTKNAVMLLKGQVKRSFPGRYPVPGYLQIELVGDDGRVLKSTNITHKRKSIKARYAEFSVPLPDKMEKVNFIRITHRKPVLQSDDKVNSIWQDVNIYK